MYTSYFRNPFRDVKFPDCIDDECKGKLVWTNTGKPFEYESWMKELWKKVWIRGPNPVIQASSRQIRNLQKGTDGLIAVCEIDCSLRVPPQ